MVRDTSIEIYRKITDEGLLSKKRQQVYDIIFHHGPMTGSQVAAKYKLMYSSAKHSESIRNRITELVKQKVVKEVGVKECPITGNKVLWFDVTADLPVKIPKKLTMKQKKTDLLFYIEELGHRLPEGYKGDMRKIYKIAKGL